ncbi:MAG: hypothetical protein B7Y11_10910, partial [Sphingobacteriia bacterium 24-36-13]
SIEIDDGLILNSTIERIDQNYTKEIIFMKWGKVATIIKDSNELMVHFNIEKGATIDHIKKKIFIKQPVFDKK